MGERIKKPASHERDEQTEEAAEGVGVVAVDGAVQEKGEDIKSEVDDLLDEIDDVLEQNAHDFVKNYIQEGGQ
ncbi:MAG: ubiquitin-like protein Pup [Candidatus Saccharibacteria bacterium]|nr:ubiquitin-like protein Pup [Candidatus Saccharibacteria bacterium]